MRWLRDLFVSQQRRDCRFALDVMAEGFEAELAWPAVRNAVERALRKDEPAVKRRMIVGGETAAAVIGDMVAITCLNEIETGRYHLYRGVLDQLGQSRRNIFARLVTEQLRDGLITVQEAGVANENMKSAVRNAG